MCGPLIPAARNARRLFFHSITAVPPTRQNTYCCRAKRRFQTDDARSTFARLGGTPQEEPVMAQIITLGVYRRLDNRLQNLGDDSQRAWELYYRRRDALYAVVDDAGPVPVTNWGDTDDKTPTHEFVELTLSVAAGAALQYAIVPGLKWLGQKVAEKAVDTALDELPKWAISKLRKEQETNTRPPA